MWCLLCQNLSPGLYFLLELQFCLRPQGAAIYIRPKSFLLTKYRGLKIAPCLQREICLCLRRLSKYEVLLLALSLHELTAKLTVLMR